MSLSEGHILWAHKPFLNPMVAILDLAGGAVFQAVQCSRMCGVVNFVTYRDNDDNFVVFYKTNHNETLKMTTAPRKLQHTAEASLTVFITESEGEGYKTSLF